MVDSENAFILVDDITDMSEEGHKSIFKGIGKYRATINDFMEMLNPSLMEHIGYARITKQRVELEDGVIFPLNNEKSQAIGVIYVEGTNRDEGVELRDIYER